MGKGHNEFFSYIRCISSQGEGTEAVTPEAKQEEAGTTGAAAKPGLGTTQQQWFLYYAFPFQLVIFPPFLPFPVSHSSIVVLLISRFLFILFIPTAIAAPSSARSDSPAPLASGWDFSDDDDSSYGSPSPAPPAPGSSESSSNTPRKQPKGTLKVELHGHADADAGAQKSGGLLLNKKARPTRVRPLCLTCFCRACHCNECFAMCFCTPGAV